MLLNWVPDTGPTRANTNASFSTPGFFEKVQGSEVLPELPIPDAIRKDFPTTTALQRQGVKTRPGVFAIERIQYVQSPYLEDWEYLESLLPADTNAN